MKNETNNTKVQIDGKQNLAKDNTNIWISLGSKMKFLTAIVSVCAISISASAEEVYNFYFQKSAPQETAISVSGSEKSFTIAQEQVQPIAKVESAVAIDKKEELKRFRISAGFALLSAPIEQDSELYDYDSDSYYNLHSYSEHQMSGMQVSAKYNLNKFFGVELGIFDGSTISDNRKINMQLYGFAINTVPDSKNWELEIGARNTSITDSNIQNKLNLAARVGYKFDEKNGVSLESNLMDFKGKSKANSYYALSYVFYL